MATPRISRICSVDNCERPALARGFCKRHYNSIWMNRNGARTCSIDGCKNAILARGWCSAHYQRWERHGDPLIQAHAANGSGHAWILQHVDYEGEECLIWPYSRSAYGYGDLWAGDQHWTAHRLMCQLAHGDPPTPKHEVLHTCGNGHLGCVNPNHLRYGTSKENKADMVRHGNSLRGRKNPNVKLTEQDVIQIRKLLEGGSSQQSIANTFNVSRGSIYLIKRRYYT